MGSIEGVSFVGKLPQGLKPSRKGMGNCSAGSAAPPKCYYYSFLVAASRKVRSSSMSSGSIRVNLIPLPT
jgi:hypothetical protein